MAASDRKVERLETRLPAEAKQQIELAAAMQGRTVSDFVVAAALEQASKVIEQQRVIKLTVSEGVALAKYMVSEPVVSKKNVEAIRRHRKVTGR